MKIDKARRLVKELNIAIANAEGENKEEIDLVGTAVKFDDDARKDLLNAIEEAEK